MEADKMPSRVSVPFTPRSLRPSLLVQLLFAFYTMAPSIHEPRRPLKRGLLIGVSGGYAGKGVESNMDIPSALGELHSHQDVDIMHAILTRESLALMYNQ